MKTKRILASLVCAVMIANITSGSVSALNIGEEYQFNAGESIRPNVSGSEDTDTRSYEQQLADSANKQAMNEFSRFAEGYFDTLDLVAVPQYVKAPDRYILVYDDDTEKTILQELANYRDNFKPGGYWRKTSNYETGEVTVPDVTEAEMNALESIVNGLSGDGNFEHENPKFNLGDLTQKTLVETVSWEYIEEPSRNAEVSTFIDELKTADKTGHVVREIGEESIIDFKYYDKRFEALQDYLDTFASEQTVKTELIIEYKIESVGRVAPRTSNPINWPGTNQTHLWEFTCTSSYDGLPRAPITRYGGNSVSQAFYYAGDYHCTATQILEQSYYDAITYSRSIYWVVADTGQVIYKDEDKGSTINLDLPMMEQSLDNVFYYNKINEGVFYTTVYERDIQVTQNMFAGSAINSSGVWEYNFSTKRLK